MKKEVVSKMSIHELSPKIIRVFAASFFFHKSGLQYQYNSTII